MTKKRLINVDHIEYIEYKSDNTGFTIVFHLISGRIINNFCKTEPEADNFYSQIKSLITNNVENITNE